MTLRRNSSRLLQLLEKCEAPIRIADTWRDFQESNVRVLGIDINTNSTGVVVLNESGTSIISFKAYRVGLNLPLKRKTRSLR